jgi:hypothetical protein
MTGNRVPLATIKEAVAPGRVFEVTNHIITRPDHPLSGTIRRTVTRTTSRRFYLSHPARGESEVDWPPAAQVQMDGDGTIRLYGGGLGQDPDDLFLTLVPVTNGVPARCPACTGPEHDQCGNDPTCHCCRDAASRREGDA